MPPSTYNILMYSHDTYGLGHIRRTMAIASHLLGPGVNILILTGSPIVGRFTFPEGVDFVRIPGMIKKSNSVYVPHSIKVNAKHALHIRRNIITATARAFDPKLFIVDKVPLGLKGEVEPTLRWFKKTRPNTKVILGLRDILDDAESTIQEWMQREYYRALEELYSEIWVYGTQQIYDPITEYRIPEAISRKMLFTGYIPRAVPAKHFGKRLEKNDDRHKVVVTTGGGGDGYPVLDAYLRMIENNPNAPLKSTMISGPFLPLDMRDEIAARARSLGVLFTGFSRKIEKEMAKADIIVSMGGYNTVCETLSLKKPSLIIPRESPRMEQRIRAQVLSDRGLCRYLPWSDLDPDSLYTAVMDAIDAQQPMRQAIDNFDMTGLEVMRARLSDFRREET